VSNLRAERPDRELGDALLDQRLVAGIGNVWRAEALWHAGLSPWLPVGKAGDEELERVLRQAARLMHSSVENGRERRAVYRRPGRACRRCGEAIRSRGQGEANRIAYWCPGCQKGEGSAGA
jgi:endonuclease VIII